MRLHIRTQDGVDAGLVAALLANQRSRSAGGPLLRAFQGRGVKTSHPAQQIPLRPTHLFRASAAARQLVHFLALWAGALGVVLIGRGGVATAYTEELLRSLERRGGRPLRRRPR